MVVAILLTVIGIAFLIGWWLSAPGYQGPSSDHFTGKRFINAGNVEAKGFKDVMKWMVNRDQGAWTYQDATPGEAPPASIDSGCRITFVNHSTFLIQVDGLNILIDPVWSERVSPFSFAGPKRMRPPGIQFDDLPAIDIVLISHNHYDHLDKSTLQRLEETYQPTVIAPLGNKAYLQSIGLTKIVERDWWEDTTVQNVGIRIMPAQHFSGRGLFDRDKTLWCGFTIESKWGAIYYAGDTGYGPFFKEIGAYYDTIKAAIIPIGAFQPKWFMSPIHIGPEEAIQVHHDINSHYSIGCHYGTFPLADDGMNEPQETLQQLLTNQATAKPFMLLPEGDSWFQP